MKKTVIQKSVQIKNKKAYFEYEFLDKLIAGMVLKGSEIKSIRQGKVSLNEAYCFINKEEVFVKAMNIAVYEQATHFSHEPTRERKLLLQKREIQKLEDKLKDKGLTVIPIRLFITDRGFAKLEIALAKGKKLHDKRDSIKEKDMKREMDRRGY